MQLTSSPLERARKNIVAIKALNEMSASCAPATRVQIDALAAYSGWGGAPDAFRDSPGGPASWAEVNAQLRSLLSDDEYASARSSTLTAFYTPRPVIEAVFSSMDRMGFGSIEGGAAVLEPGCGTGNFMACAPSGYRLTGVEVDPLSARIAGALHPESTVITAALEDCYIAPSSFDLVVGNVPYSESITIKSDDGRRMPIHDWFIEKSIEAVRPGGMVAVLTSRYTMDKRSTATRERIAREADLAAIARMPRETFHAQAGTDVTCDLVVFRKKTDPAVAIDEMPAWVGTEAIEGGVTVNAWVAAHPECIIGDMAVTSGRFGPEVTVTSTMAPDEIGRAVASALDAQLAHLGDVAASLGDRSAEPICTASVPSCARVFEYQLGDDGTIWYGNGEAVEPVQLSNPSDRARLAAMVSLRDKVRDTISLETRDPSDEAVGHAISQLDSAYEEFTSEYGRICERRNGRSWKPSDDPTVMLLKELEVVDANGRFVRKADVLSHRVRTPEPPAPSHIDDPSDAIAVSLDRRGRVDAPFIASLMDIPEADVERALAGLALRDPESGEMVTATDYYTGNVGRKLDAVRSMIADELDAGASDARRAWLDQCGISSGIDDLRGDKAARSAISHLKRCGAWQSMVDPMSSTVAVIPGAHFEGITRNLRYSQVSAAALGLAIAESMGDGSQPLVEMGDDGTASPVGLWRDVIRTTSYRGGDSSVSATMAMAMVGMLSSDADDAAVAAFAEAVIGDGYRDALARVTGIEIPDAANRYSSFNEREERGRARFAAAIEAVRRMRDEPGIPEYLATCGATQAESAGYRPDAFASASTEGYAEFSSRRSEFIASRSKATDAARVEGLREIERNLVAAMPPRLEADQVSAPLGAPWIPACVVRDFVTEVFLARSYKTPSELRKISVSYNDGSGTWQVKAGGSGSVPVDVSERFGTDDRTCFSILESALNKGSMEVTRPDPADPSGKARVKDPEATARAWERRRAVERAWDEWVWSDPGRAKMLTDIYNARFNTIVARSYDGSALTFPGSNPQIKLRRHQKDAVCRILRSDEGTLVAHAVGAGKTITGVAAAVEAKRIGKASKPMFAVPNHLTGQWADEFCALYPGSRVIYMTSDDTKSQEAAQRFWARVAMGDWDAVIVGHSRFSQLKVSQALRESYFEQRVRELDESIREARGSGNDFSVKQGEAQKKRLQARMDTLRKDDRIPGFSFDDLGVDMLFVDEAHAFKNLAVATSMNVAGVSVAASAKCEDLLDKCTYLRNCGHGSNIVFLTGTPVSNTMAELYNMQRYLAPNLLSDQGVSSFSAWAKTFGKVSDSVEIKPEGTGFQVKQRFSKFCNLPELMAGFHSYADIMTADDLDLDVPECEVVPVAVQATDEQAECVRELADRAADVRSGRVDPSADNMLKITGDGRKIALDPKLVDQEREPLDGGKVEACARNVAEVYKRTSPDSGTQLVFCDTSTPASGSWNIYDDIKRRLIDAGIPEDEIAFVSDAGDNPHRREALFERVRGGEVRVLLGSTQKLGTGTNVQDRLAAIHDLDCPWRPSDLEQRQGRVRRQGNMYDKVSDYRYVTVGTFDSYLYQIVERKQSFISQVFTNANPARDSPDFDEAVLSYAEVKALATGDPSIVQRMELENKIGQLNLLRQADRDAKAALANKVSRIYEPTVTALERKCSAIEDDMEAFRSARTEIKSEAASGRWSMEIGGAPYIDKEAACAAILSIADASRTGSREIGEYHGLKIDLTTESTADDAGRPVYASYLSVRGAHGHENEFRRSVPRSKSGQSTAITQIDKIIDRVASGPGELAARLEADRADLESARESLATPWDGERELAELKRRLDSLPDPIAEPSTKASADLSPDAMGAAARVAASRDADHGPGNQSASVKPHA